jgi:hypothetical protein
MIVEFLDRPVPPFTVVYRRSLSNSLMLPMAMFRFFILYYVLLLFKKQRKENGYGPLSSRSCV